MLPVEIITKKRNGRELATEEIQFLIEGFTEGSIPDYQMSAWAMAVYLRGVTLRETYDLTMAMTRSGKLLKPVGAFDRLDKHSTGGLGDKTSLIIAPVLAALGYHVPMLSGRSLGLTGGTLDKLEAIPGFRVNLTESEMERQLESVGCFITGTTAEVVPADRKLYALRDVTATVPSVGLITASILSKKLAESLRGLVLDIKVGGGSFNVGVPEAQRLRKCLMETAKLIGLPCTSLISDMTQPLGQMVGNACEVNESMEVLKGGGPTRVRELSVELCTRLISRSIEGANNAQKVRQAVNSAIDSGAAFEKYEKMVVAQGGKGSDRLPLEREHVVRANRAGVVTEIDCERIGASILAMGGSRHLQGDTINPSVGVRWLAELGTVLVEGEPIAIVYCNDANKAQKAVTTLESSLKFDSRSCREFLPLWMA